MELQEIFNVAVEHFRRQGQRSVEYLGAPGTYCMYRGPNGLKCAIGVFIPDDEYRDWMEGRSSQYIPPPPAFRDESGKWLSIEHCDLAHELQDAHDDSTSPSKLNQQLENIRLRFSLAPFVPIEKWC